MNIRPLADRVLIKPAAAEEKTLGGIIIPDSAKEKPLKGEIVAVGNGTKDEEITDNLSFCISQKDNQSTSSVFMEYAFTIGV